MRKCPRCLSSWTFGPRPVAMDDGTWRWRWRCLVCLAITYGPASAPRSSVTTSGPAQTKAVRN